MFIDKQILLLAGLFVIVLILFTCNRCNPPDIQRSSDQEDTLQWVNGAGDIVSSWKADPSFFEQHDKELLDSVAKTYHTKPSKIIEYVIANTNTNTDLQPEGKPTADDYTYVDTCPPVPKNLKQNFSSAYYKATVQIGDSSFMHLQAFDTVTLLWKKVNEGNIFNRRHLIQLDVSTANPDTKVSGIKAYRITEKPKRWAIGFGIGYGFPLKGQSFQPVPFAGVSITKTFIRF